MKILILTAATGGGHLRASSALKSYILETQDDCEVEIVDTLKYISPLLDKTVTEAMKPWQSGRRSCSALYTNPQTAAKAKPPIFSATFSANI